MNVRTLIDKHSAPEPTELEKLRFSEYVRAVENPGVILDDLEAGQVSDEVLETWEALYPEELEELRGMVAEEVERNIVAGQEYGEMQVRALNKLMGASDDGYVLAMQRAYEQPEPEMQAPPMGQTNISEAMPTRLDKARWRPGE
jgi:hypothetical protein